MWELPYYALWVPVTLFLHLSMLEKRMAWREDLGSTGCYAILVRLVLCLVFCLLLLFFFFISYLYFVQFGGGVWYTVNAIGQFAGSKDSSQAILPGSKRLHSARLPVGGVVWTA